MLDGVKSAYECRLLLVSSILGYGFSEPSLERTLERKPHFISDDGGVADPGAYYMGSGACLNSRKAPKTRCSSEAEPPPRGTAATRILAWPGVCLMT